MADRLYRSRDDRMLAGVAGGLAASIDADPSLVRVVWVIVGLLSGGIAVVVYVVMAIVVPEAPSGYVWPKTGATESGPTVDDGRHRGRSTAMVFGLALIAVGAYFLVRQFMPDVDLSLAWPVLSLILGIALVVLSLRPRGSAG